MHRIATILSALSAAVLTVFAASPAAFAVTVVPNDGGEQAMPPVSPAVHHAGLYGWQIAAFIVIGAVVVVLAVIAIRRLVWAPRRAALQ